MYKKSLRHLVTVIKSRWKRAELGVRRLLIVRVLLVDYVIVI